MIALIEVTLDSIFAIPFMSWVPNYCTNRRIIVHLERRLLLAIERKCEGTLGDWKSWLSTSSPSMLFHQERHFEDKKKNKLKVMLARIDKLIQPPAAGQLLQKRKKLYHDCQLPPVYLEMKSVLLTLSLSAWHTSDNFVKKLTKSTECQKRSILHLFFLLINQQISYRLMGLVVSKAKWPYS